MYVKNTNRVLQNQPVILFIALPLLVLGSPVWFTPVYPIVTNSLHLVPQFQNLLKRKGKKPSLNVFLILCWGHLINSQHELITAHAVIEIFASLPLGDSCYKYRTDFFKDIRPLFLAIKNLFLKHRLNHIIPTGFRIISLHAFTHPQPKNLEKEKGKNQCFLCSFTLFYIPP